MRRRSPRRKPKTLLSNTEASEQLHARAIKSLPGGVASNFQAGDPYPIYLEKGKGSSVWDVDGTEYKDFHGGFGVNVVGHAHPKIVEALTKAASNAIHFAVTTPDTIALAEAICERFQLEQMRFVNSGTEATMDAIRVARAATGRDKIIKMEGSYHGHHDSVLFSVVPEADVLDMRFHTGGTGDQSWYTTEPTSKGVPAGAVGHRRRRAVQRRRRGRGGARRQRGPDRRGDPRAGDDEHRHRRAGARLPPGARATPARSTARS